MKYLLEQLHSNYTKKSGLLNKSFGADERRRRSQNTNLFAVSCYCKLLVPVTAFAYGFHDALDTFDYLVYFGSPQITAQGAMQQYITMTYNSTGSEKFIVLVPLT